MANITLPAYLKWRDGRPRWEPGPRLRAKGFKGRDFKSDIGQWLGLDAAIAAADALNREVAEWRATGTPRLRPTARPARATRSCRALYEQWIASPRFEKLRASTQDDYRRKAARWLETFEDAPVPVLARQDLYGWWEECYREHGHATANGTIAVIRSMLTYGTLKGWRADNPATKLGLETLPPRVVVWTPAECAAMVEAADGMGLHAVGDASVIALHTAQRLADVLALEFARTQSGYAEFRQSKTGARVRVPLTDQLYARLTSIRQRRATAAAVVPLAGIGRIVLRDGSGDPHTGRSFNDAFRSVRAIVAEQHPDVTGKWFLDYRDTAITRLALAGATLPEIRAISGHKLDTIASVLQHYLALDHRMADAGHAKLRDWMQQEGIAV